MTLSFHGGFSIYLKRERGGGCHYKSRKPYVYISRGGGGGGTDLCRASTNSLTPNPKNRPVIIFVIDVYIRVCIISTVRVVSIDTHLD